MSEKERNQDRSGYEDSSSEVSRRNFVAGSASVVAAGAAVGMMGAASNANAAVSLDLPRLTGH